MLPIWFVTATNVETHVEAAVTVLREDPAALH
jgi:hypothetical protein